MSNLVVRSIAGIVFSVVVICSALLGQLALGLLFLVFASIGLYEFYTITGSGRKGGGIKWTGLIVGMMLYCAIFMISAGATDEKYLWIFGLIVSLMLCFRLIRPNPFSIQDAAYTMMGWIYVIIPFGLVNLLAQIEGDFSYELPVGFFLILWANDSGAYFIGKFFGRHKLYEKISPNKTWEGLFGGVAFAFAAAYGLSIFFFTVTTTQWLVISLIISIFGNLGDLFESQLKRTHNIKDSGNIIPGHGGVLDRFDGLLVAMPVVICYLELCN